MGTITVVGLGPGSAGHLSLETMALLQSDAQVILRTAVHPTVEELQKQNVQFTACDEFYEKGANFEEVYANVVARVLQAAESGDVVYAVPGSPLVAERTVVLLRTQAKERGIELIIKPAMSFLDLAYVALGIDPINKLQILDAQDDTTLMAAGCHPMMITQVYSRLVASDLKVMLMESLPDDYEIYFLRNLGLPDEDCRPIKLYDLDRQMRIDHLTSIYVPELPEDISLEELAAEPNEMAAREDVLELVKVQPKFYDANGELLDDLDDDFDEDYDDEYEYEEENFNEVEIQPLVDVIATLREPGGCPWDIEQTHESIRSNFIEEVYEFIEAVDNKDVDGMREELGDVLMQVVFHARMAEEADKFDLQEVIDEVTDKLIRRHPHVFGDLSVSGSEEVLKNWDAIKKQEKTERKSALDGIAQGLPALLRAYKLQSKAAKVGFDWQEVEPVWEKVQEELGELQEAIASGDKKAAEAELGDVLFAIVNYARHHKIEPEVALEGTNNRFASRFAYVEQEVQKSGKAWQDFSLAELDAFWDAAKKLEKQE